jgi:hypothetical protein
MERLRSSIGFAPEKIACSAPSPSRICRYLHGANDFANLLFFVSTVAFSG